MALGVMEFTILVDPSLVNMYINLVCLIYAWSKGVNIMHFHYMTWPRPSPCPGGHDIYNFGRPFLSQIDYILSLSEQCLGVRQFLKE